ncbi:MAG: tryptophan--tRNA ligase [Mycoplasmataceae bacterium]|nr:tryptophan--tRNA ligase [Mycoplasmataceae bacterium]
MKKRIVSGITATGSLTIGNYIGAIKNFIKHQNDYEMFIFVADLHALTTTISPEELDKNRKEILALYIACGLNHKKSTIFFQSDVPAHSIFNWITITNTTMGELSRMNQFKDKSAKTKQSNGTDNIPTGLFVYPTLMAADILLYNPEFVPVGVDQKQHLELTRNLASRLNKKYNLNFNEPKPLFSEIGSKIMSLKSPEFKMSKSDNDKNASIFLLDDPDLAFDKIKKSVTDSENKVYYSKDKPGVNNLLTIYASLSEITIEKAEEDFKNSNYKEFKEVVGSVVRDFLIEIQKKYSESLINLPSIAKEGSIKANVIAEKNIAKILNHVGYKKF